MWRWRRPAGVLVGSVLLFVSLPFMVSPLAVILVAVRQTLALTTAAIARRPSARERVQPMRPATKMVLTLCTWMVVFGCSGPQKYWYHSTGNTSAIRATFPGDKYQCQKEASYIGWTEGGGWLPGRVEMETNWDLFKSCMEARGWSLR